MPDGVKPDPKNNQVIMDLKRPTTTTEVNILLGMVQYYQDMWKGFSQILEKLTTESLRKWKVSQILWNDDLGQVFNNTKKTIFDETILNEPYG